MYLTIYLLTYDMIFPIINLFCLPNQGEGIKFSMCILVFSSGNKNKIWGQELSS